MRNPIWRDITLFTDVYTAVPAKAATQTWAGTTSFCS